MPEKLLGTNHDGRTAESRLLVLCDDRATELAETPVVVSPLLYPSLSLPLSTVVPFSRSLSPVRTSSLARSVSILRVERQLATATVVPLRLLTVPLLAGAIDCQRHRECDAGATVRPLAY